MTAWSDLEKRIDDGDLRGVVDLVRGLSDEERRLVAKKLPPHLTKLRARYPWQWDAGPYGSAMRIAGAGTISGAAAVATWLRRRDFTSRWTVRQDTEQILRVLAGRSDEWLSDLARHLSARLRDDNLTDVDLVLTLLRDTGVEPPRHDPLVVGWVRDCPPRSRDPLLRHLLPRVFEAEGVGRELDPSDGNDRGTKWARTAVALAQRGKADRAVLLDGCVSRFLRGGDVRDLRFFVLLHELLESGDPKVRRADTSARARDHLRLLPAAPAPVAELSLRLLRELDDLDRLDVTEALEALLFRSEAGLVGRGLTWLSEVVRRDPSLADECAPALAQTFTHTSPTVRKKAAALALKLPLQDPTPIREAIPLLPVDLGAKLAVRFGGETAGVDHDPAPPPLTLDSLRTPARLVRDGGPDPTAPVDTVADLGALFFGFSDWETSERLLAGVVRFFHEDPGALRAALRPWLVEHADPEQSAAERTYRSPVWRSLHEWRTMIGRALLRSGPVPAHPVQRVPSVQYASSLLRLGLHRHAELLQAIVLQRVPPVLLATPTHPTGHVAPLTLIERLETYESLALTPGEADLQQALLRLPRPMAAPYPPGVPTPTTAELAEAIRRASALASPTGEIVARWLAGDGIGESRIRKLPGGFPDVMLDTPATGLPLIDEIFNGPPRNVPYTHSWFHENWPTLLPSHPDAAAVYLLTSGYGENRSVVTLAELTSGNGPLAGLIAAKLVPLLDERDEHAEYAVALMTARGDLPAARFGAEIARLSRGISLKRVADALTVLAEAGGHQAVWEVAAAAIPGLLPKPGEQAPSALAVFLSLANRTARWCEAEGDIPELTAVASRKGGSNFLQEARNLRDTLARSNS